jgi:hypothetical protein
VAFVITAHYAPSLVNEHVSKWHIVTTVVLNVKDNYRPNPVYILIGVMAIAVLAIILNYYNSL